MPSNETVWEMDAQTKGKHEVLREYLNAWVVILGRSPGRIVFIDGFAGPGQYLGGEEGSPLIALRALDDHRARAQIQAEVVFLFIEKDPARAEHLRSLLARRSPDPKINVEVAADVFDARVTSILDELERDRQRLAPSFVMIDPFGVSGFPLATVRRILQYRSCEVFVSLMTREINRFHEHPNFEQHLDELFGCEDWRAIFAGPAADRVALVCQLYDQQLRAAGAKYVLRFELRRDGHHVYNIFFATKNELGCQKMKEAIWRVIKSSDFVFRGNRSDQLGFDLVTTDMSRLVADLRTKFGHDWVTIEAVDAFMQTDATLFHGGHLRTATLKPMEARQELEVRGPEGRRRNRGQYPAGTSIRFV